MSHINDEQCTSFWIKNTKPMRIRPFVHYLTHPASRSWWVQTIRCYRTFKCDFPLQYKKKPDKKWKYSYDFRLTDSVYFCLYPSVYTSASRLPLFNHPCPSLLCLVHWSIALTLRGVFWVSDSCFAVWISKPDGKLFVLS